MIFRLLAVTFFVSLTATWPLPAVSAPLESVLRPYVVPLDRDLWVFRYESEDSFRPESHDDLIPRIANWAHRFDQVDIISGADTGPGVYVATDPVATATWGRKNPRLFALKIKKGTRILIGDQAATPDGLRLALNEIARSLGCTRSSTKMDYGLGNAVGFFRMNENRSCREAIISAVQSLQIQAISYGFNSVPLENCRTTGTAISIINSQAISLNELNWYSESHRIEGAPDVSPYISGLFEEAKNDFYSQSLLANLSVWDRFKKGYGFFDGLSADPTKKVRSDYEEWKAANILKCGPQWSVESSRAKYDVDFNRMRSKPHPKVADLLIRLSLVYRDRYERSHATLSQKTAPEFRIQNTYQILGLSRNERPRTREINTMKYQFAQIPLWSDNRRKDTDDYLKFLESCLAEYSDESKELSEIVKGACGVIAE